MSNIIANAIDELIMNAVFTAPTDTAGRRIYDQANHEAALALEGKTQVDVSIAFDGIQVGISVSDLYGSIDKEKVHRNLSALSKDEVQKKEDHGKSRMLSAGSGIGLASIYRSGGSLICLSEKNTRTEVCAIFERVENVRKFKDQFRCILNQYYY